MIQTELTKKALVYADRMHQGQYDKGGNPYILHPIAVAESMPDEISASVALLHDVLEDTDTTWEDLISAGFPPAVVDTVLRLTRKKQSSQTYMEYIQSLRCDPVAVQVKMADLRQNLDLSRLNLEPTARDFSLVKRYKKALELLEHLGSSEIKEENL